jgi:hypothetical protein
MTRFACMGWMVETGLLYVCMYVCILARCMPTTELRGLGWWVMVNIASLLEGVAC